MCRSRDESLVEFELCRPPEQQGALGETDGSSGTWKMKCSTLALAEFAWPKTNPNCSFPEWSFPGGQNDPTPHGSILHASRSLQRPYLTTKRLLTIFYNFRENNFLKYAWTLVGISMDVVQAPETSASQPRIQKSWRRPRKLTNIAGFGERRAPS